MHRDKKDGNRNHTSNSMRINIDIRTIAKKIILQFFKQ